MALDEIIVAVIVFFRLAKLIIFADLAKNAAKNLSFLRRIV